MTYSFPPDVAQLVREKMASGKYASQDDLLRDALHSLTEEEEDLAAVRDAIAEHAAGDEGVPLDDAFVAVRERHQSPRSS